ncbi:hypothetical protein KE480_16530 [Enterococcus sp. 079]|nr:hypothetical protein [Enterococcus sp. 079]
MTDLNVFLLIFENALDTTLTIWDKLYISLCVISETGNEAKDINAIILAMDMRQLVVLLMLPIVWLISLS